MSLGKAREQPPGDSREGVSSSCRVEMLALEAASSRLMPLWGSWSCSAPESNHPRKAHSVTGQPLARHFLQHGKVSATPENCLSPDTAT